MNLSAKKKKTVVDPVCGMAVVPGVKEIITSIDGEIYYFCAEDCRQSFEENPVIDCLKRQPANLITDDFTSTIPVFRYYESGTLLVRRNFGGELRYQEVEFRGCELLPSLQHMA